MYYVKKSAQEELNPTRKTLLVANRGEIAIRIIRAAKDLGLNTISIYSYEDRLSMHRYKADESYQIGAEGQYSPIGAYLAIDEIISIAKARNVSLIHPGYGFLAENSEFARKVEEAGIAFVGPLFQTIDSLGDKTKARNCAIAAGVSVVPGSPGPIENSAQAVEFAKLHGLPVIIKAAMGGGGRGMRVVRDMDSLAHLFERAQSEAIASFGDGTCFIERFLEKPRHIEVQLIGDSYGNIIHLFERDCSIQRRHQKVVEIAPASGLPQETLNGLLSDAVKIAKHVGYQNAGTAEFLVDSDNRHYFIEINPRIQVEHTITEEITGIDLVSSQIEIACGKSLADLGLSQESVTVRGCAIQARITTEDASAGFRPDTGRIEVYRSSGGAGVRLDGGPGYSGAVITPHYDSLLVKCICSGPDFESARRRSVRALSEFRVRGVTTNIPFLLKLLQNEEFVANKQLWTTFIDDTPSLVKNLKMKNRGQKMLQFLAELVVNGPKLTGQSGLPKLQSEIAIPEIPGIPSVTESSSKGWRNILVEKGPSAFSEAIRAHKGVLIMDTTWRDAHQSLLATRVRTIDLKNIAIQTSHVMENAFSLEMWGGATFDVSMRFLYECPWDRLRALRKLVPNVPFQMLLRGANAVGYTNYPDNVVYAFCKKAVEEGIDVFRVFDSLNYIENLNLGIDAVKKAGGVVEAAISYTGDVSNPNQKRYNLDYYLDLVEKLVNEGIHILGIKDMAGLLKPRAATILISAIRQKWPDLPIHLHTHDTAGTGIATYLAAAAAGVDIVDLAIDSMSGMTSQPCMGAFIGSVYGTENDTGIDSNQIHSLNGYWEQVRLLYSCFDPGLKSCDSGVYETEIPGGQYTNLLFQATSLGLGSMWEDVKKSYIAANRLCGGIVKVTPSSKVVGDLAQFMVSNGLSEQDVIDQVDSLMFPLSVVEYFQGYLGEPYYGYMEPFRTRLLETRKLKKVEGRPGKRLPPLDLESLHMDLEESWGTVVGGSKISECDVISAALYPKVFNEYRSRLEEYGDLSKLPTYLMLTPMKIGQEVSFKFEQGKKLIINLMAIGQLNEETRKRDVYFHLNGETRVVSVIDTKLDQEKQTSTVKVSRKKANKTVLGEIGSPMNGTVVEVLVHEGDEVKVGDSILILSAMKMETVVTAPKAGKVKSIFVAASDSITPGDLVAIIE